MNKPTAFEKKLIDTVNFINNKEYKHEDLMEWSTIDRIIDKNIKDGEVKYSVLDVCVAVKDEGARELKIRDKLAKSTTRLIRSKIRKGGVNENV